LRESGVGRVMFFYTKCPRIEPKVKRVADQLVAKWSRPILRRSADYREKRLQTKEYHEDDRYGHFQYRVMGIVLSLEPLQLI
jgi:transcription factor SPN1